MVVIMTTAITTMMATMIDRESLFFFFLSGRTLTSFQVANTV